MKTRILMLMSVFALAIVFVGSGFSLKREKDYQKAWASAHDGVIEVRLSDAARVDIVTDTNAIEVDYAHKWAESIGQALYYSAMTHKRAGILLIMGPRDEVFMTRLKTAIAYHKLEIDVWVVEK